MHALHPVLLIQYAAHCCKNTYLSADCPLRQVRSIATGGDWLLPVLQCASGSHHPCPENGHDRFPSRRLLAGEVAGREHRRGGHCDAQYCGADGRPELGEIDIPTADNSALPAVSTGKQVTSGLVPGCHAAGPLTLLP